MKKILIILGVLVFLINGCDSNNSVMEIPLSEISEEAKFYDYNFGDTTVKFFSVKSKDGSIKTAFDACDVCYRSKKGYSQEGDYMICNNCGNKYAISGLGTQNKNPGGCWPSYLYNKIIGDNLVIKVSDLEKGEGKF